MGSIAGGLNWFAVVVMFVCFVGEINSSSEVATSRSRVLSRRRRYVTFPEGSSFSCAVCLTVGVIGQPAPITSPGMFVLALNWGIAYELPNETYTVATIQRYKKIKRPIVMRRNRRDLYDKLETIIDNMGYSGRDCILKTLCETTQRIMPKGSNMLEEVFRTIFTLPLTKVFLSEPPEHSIYDAAHRLGTMMENCDVYKCPLSLVDLAQGYYNAPSPPFDTAKNPLAWFSNSIG